MWKVINKLSIILNMVLITMVISFNKDKKDIYSKLNREQVTKIIDRYIDTSGNEHVVNTPVLINSNELNHIEHTDTYKLIDSLSKELKIANNKISNISRVHISTNSTTIGNSTDSIYTYKDSVVSWTFNPALSILNFKADFKLKIAYFI